MLKTSLSILSLFCVIAVTLAVPASGQTMQTKQEKQTVKVKEKVKKLGLGQRVRVSLKLYNDTQYKGYVSAANEDDFIVIDGLGNPQTIRYSDVKSIGGRNLSTGAKIGIGIAIGVGAVFAFLAILFATLND